MKQPPERSTAPSTSEARGAAAACAESHTIKKLTPKIRIVHVVAPEVIQTDAANFRDLVQRLTGKSARRSRARKWPAAGGQRAHADVVTKSAAAAACGEGREAAGFDVKVEVRAAAAAEEEEELWSVHGPPAQLFGGVGDLDVFMQGLGDLPLAPLLSSSHADLFGEQISSGSSER